MGCGWSNKSKDYVVEPSTDPDIGLSDIPLDALDEQAHLNSPANAHSSVRSPVSEEDKFDLLDDLKDDEVLDISPRGSRNTRRRSYVEDLMLKENELQESVIHASYNAPSTPVHQDDFYDVVDKRQNAFAPEEILSFSCESLRGRSCKIRTLSVSPCETRLVVASYEDCILVMYDLLTDEELLHFEGHYEAVFYCTFSPTDGRQVASASRDCSAIIWDSGTGKRFQTLEHPGQVYCCNFSGHAKYIVTVCSDSACRVWDTKNGREITCFKQHDGLVLHAAFSSILPNIISCASDRTVLVWEAKTGRVRHRAGHGKVVIHGGFLRNDRYFLSHDDQCIRTWGNKDGRREAELRIEDFIQKCSVLRQEGRDPKFIAATYTGTGHIVMSTNDKMLFLYDPETGDEVISLRFKWDVNVISATAKNTIALGDLKGNIYILKLKLASDALRKPTSWLKNPDSILG